MSKRPLKVFVAYAHNDETLANELGVHLALLERQRIIEVWNRRRIQAGQDLKIVTQLWLDEAEIIIVLLSATFIASELYEKELVYAIDRQITKKMCILPVLLRPFDLPKGTIGALRIVPINGKAITAWTDRNAAWSEIASFVRETALGYQSNALDSQARTPIDSVAITPPIKLDQKERELINPVCPSVKILFIRERTGQQHIIELPLLMRVGDIKTEIIRRFEIPNRFDGRQFPWKLECAERILDDNRTLQESGVKDGDMMKLASGYFLAKKVSSPARIEPHIVLHANAMDELRLSNILPRIALTKNQIYVDKLIDDFRECHYVGGWRHVAFKLRREELLIETFPALKINTPPMGELNRVQISAKNFREPLLAIYECRDTRRKYSLSISLNQNLSRGKCYSIVIVNLDAAFYPIIRIDIQTSDRGPDEPIEADGHTFGSDGGEG